MSRLERRIVRGERLKLRKVGRVVVDSPRSIMSCIILDQSTTGALLLVHDKVPDRFSLFQVATRTLRNVVVARRLQDRVGVKFEGAAEVLDVDDSRLAELSVRALG